MPEHDPSSSLTEPIPPAPQHSPYRIPFNRPTSVRGTMDYVSSVLEGGYLAGDGPLTQRCEELLAARLGSPRVLLTTSCTDALEMAAILLDLEPGDEVIVPSFTFTSTALAFAAHGATPVFCDIRADTLNIDEVQLEKLFTDRTKAVVVVHYAGVGCAMDAIAPMCRERGVLLVEDNAHGLFGSFGGVPLGTFGALAAQSFHETKNITCGEGGALVLNDASFVERAEVIREKGTNRAQFKRGEVDKYTWVDTGSSFLPSDLSASVLLAQLERADEVQAKRRRVWTRYRRLLSGWCGEHGVRLPVIPEQAQQAFHMFHLVFGSQEERERARTALVERGILAVTHYVPLHSSPYGQRVGRGYCPVAEEMSGRLLRLPFFTDMSDDEVDLVCDLLITGTDR